MPGALSTQLNSPKPLFRNDVSGNSFFVDVYFYLDKLGYQYMRSYYRTGTANGSLPFNINLILEGANPALYTVEFVPGTWTLSAIEGDFFNVSCQLEAKKFG